MSPITTYSNVGSDPVPIPGGFGFVYPGFPGLVNPGFPVLLEGGGGGSGGEGVPGGFPCPCGGGPIGSLNTMFQYQSRLMGPVIHGMLR